MDARTVIEALEAAGAPLSWRDLALAVAADRARERRELRRVLSGMVRSGDLSRDHQGAYHLAVAGGVISGVLERSGKDLSLEDHAVASERGTRLRAGDRVRARLVAGEARIVEVLERSAEPVHGILRTHTRYPYVEALGPDYRGRVSLLDPPATARAEDTVAVRIVDEDRRGLVGYVVDTVSRGGGAGQAAESLLTSHGVPVEWPDGVDAQVERLPRRVNAGGHRKRRSLVELPLVTIDGETARDFDDAVYAEASGGGWRLIVAIADVAHYVRHGSPIDREAWERGNSVYLPDRVIPMLPEALSNELCSLKPRVPRLTLACDMQINARGEIESYEFYEAVIHSWQRLTYTRVQEFLDSGFLDAEPQVCASLLALHGLYGVFRDARERRGGLDFDTHESRLELDAGRVVAIHPQLRHDANRLIEEAMIAANVAAARFIESAGGRALYRVHEPPDAEKADQLRQAFAFAGIHLPRGEVTPLSVRAALTALGDVPNRWLYEYLVLRSLTQAQYRPDNQGHFGLALERYMHFTSPIRRYADLVVHRAIKGLLHGEAPAAADYLARTGVQTSQTERRADEVSWGVDAWLKCEYVEDRVGETFAGVIMGVTEFGLFVELRGFYVQGLLHISELGSDYFQYQPRAMALVGERSGQRFVLGDEIAVVLRAVVPEQGKLDLRLAGGTGDGAGRSRGRSQGKSPGKPKKKGAGDKRGGGQRRQGSRRRR